MNRAAFVLAGGHSSRMGCDKAHLLLQGRSLVEHVAAQARGVTDNITLVGEISRYANLGYPVIEDVFPGRGPLSGIHAALTHSGSEWNLILACDMPQVTAAFLVQLMARAEAGQASAVIPVGPDAVPQPLCAAYHRRCAVEAARALEHRVHKLTQALAALDIDFWPVPHSHYFRNLNTPEEWAAYSHATR
ncbi:MAG TPA: molybdenum cofactor guanylyltransferase [Bryobacteraceae bacterium]|nr:molybdenum cofactor guanylyltransferase [Bryobacteraceae bacterium]